MQALFTCKLVNLFEKELEVVGVHERGDTCDTR